MFVKFYPFCFKCPFPKKELEHLEYNAEIDTDRQALTSIHLCAVVVVVVQYWWNQYVLCVLWIGTLCLYAVNIYLNAGFLPTCYYLPKAFCTHSTLHKAWWDWKPELYVRWKDIRENCVIICDSVIICAQNNVLLSFQSKNFSLLKRLWRKTSGIVVAEETL